MLRLRVVTFFALLFLMALSACARHISDRELFRLAVDSGKAADIDTRWYIFSEIAEAEAKRGYYDDSLEALRLTDRYRGQLLEKLVSNRAKNGDVSGAKKMTEYADSPEVKWTCVESVALIQAESGDINGAMETARPLASRYKQSVLEAIGTHQAETGDLDSALKTAATMERGWSDGIFFVVAEELDKRGDKAGAKRIARRITDSDMAASFGGHNTSSNLLPSDPCDVASKMATSGDYGGALDLLNRSKCSCQYVANVHANGGDAAAAERAMRSCPNPADVSAGMADLATHFAAKGDIATALKFADEVHVTGADFEEGYLAPALRDIGRIWTSKDPKAALRWGEARPEGCLRAMALLGVAEGIGRVKNLS